ncbi:ABC transporter substrate-binding protein [Curtobacterium ammoniigenes]|uniref:ABC transporter substrate-binding protein n=1 Tax=Curtobacterium ammoniigenes TaxID=395387 RepID=UPI00082B0489|nr:extracellular solute-binding protein [Curtobacterium ammoniigenes]
MVLRGLAPRRPNARARGRSVAAIALAAVSVLGLAACSSGGSGSGGASAVAQSSSPSPSSTTTASCSPNATRLTFWGWPAGYDLAVNEFNKTHKDVCVALENAGAAGDEYTKLSDAIKAGNGAPDIATIEYFELPSFEITHSLVDLSSYGIDSAKANEAPAAWAQVSQGSHVYAMPVDLGPLALYYNQNEFSQNGLSVPTTWDQFATEAATLHTKNPADAMTNLDPENAQAMLALMQQYGAFPFTYTGGSKLGINFTGSNEMAFAKYWQDLISAKEVTTAADFSPAQWSNLDSGVNAARISPAWGPVGMQLSIKNTLGDWRAAPLPQLTAGSSASGNWGGSTLAVVKGTAHAKQAAEFVKWFGGSADSWKILSGDVAGAFPGYLPLLNNSAFQQRTLKISGSSTSNVVFAQAAKNIKAPEWPPIMTAALTQWTDTFAGVTKGTETLQQAFTKFQSQMTDYAKSQGFTVTGS